jgi:hypothetical protein
LTSLTKMKEADRQALMTQAMLDLKLAAKLMEDATPKQVAAFSVGLQTKARAMGLAAAVGANRAQSAANTGK